MRTANSPRTALVLVPSILAAMLATACSGAATAPDGEEGFVSNESSVSTQDARSWAAPFLDVSTMRGDASDWDFCNGKATCAPGEALSGLSVIPGGPGRTALCTQGNGFSGEITATLRTDNRQDERRATRGTGGDTDWDFGNYKLECGSDEYVSGVSESATQCSGHNNFHAVQCSRGSGLGDNGCSARVFSGGDSRGASSSGNWDSGAFKGECAAGEYVAGVSVSPDTLAPHAILCCPASGASSPSPNPSPSAAGDPFYAISIDQGSWGADQARTVRDLGAGMVRIQFCDWPASRPALESAVDAAVKEGLAVHAELNYCTLPKYPDSASWHKGYADSGNEFSGAFTAAAQDIASVFKGRVRVYEIWNEPDAAPRPKNWPDAFWPGPNNADWDGACGKYAYGADYGQSIWAICPKQLGVLTTNAFMAIKGADGAAKVVAGNVLFHGDDGWVAKDYWKQVEMSPAVGWFKSNKGGVPWDYIGIHPYAYRPTDGTLKAQIKDFQSIVSSFGDPAQVALTEYGWFTGNDGDAYFKADEETQASYLKATFSLAKEMGIGFVTWFNYLDGGGLTFGMRRPDMTWKPSARAFCEAASAPNCPAP